MTSFNQNTNELEITIPAKSISDLHEYQKGLLGILAEIKVNNCDKATKQNLNSVYKLMNHLKIDSEDILKYHLEAKTS
jgi:hypothetical protein